VCARRSAISAPLPGNTTVTGGPDRPSCSYQTGGGQAKGHRPAVSIGAEQSAGGTGGGGQGRCLKNRHHKESPGHGEMPRRLHPTLAEPVRRLMKSSRLGSASTSRSATR